MINRQPDLSESGLTIGHVQQTAICKSACLSGEHRGHGAERDLQTAAGDGTHKIEDNIAATWQTHLLKA